MTAITVVAFEILAAFALRFIMGRIWQIRRDELQRRVIVTVPPVAFIPLPKGSQPSAQVSASAGRPDQQGTPDLFGVYSVGSPRRV